MRSPLTSRASTAHHGLAPAQSGPGLATWNHKGAMRRNGAFFIASRPVMAGCNGRTSVLPGSFVSGSLTHCTPPPFV